MSYLGAWNLDQVVTFTVNTHSATTAGVTDGDSPPTWRCYEDGTTTPIQTDTMALFDDANTVGYYSGAIELSAANGFEVGKSYNVRVEATVGGITGATILRFQVLAAPATAAALATVDTVVDSILASLIPAIRKGTAQAGAAGTITLDAGASATDDLYNGNWIVLTGGTGAGQVRLIFDYVGSTKVTSVAPAWTTTPSTDTTFAIAPASYVQGALALSSNAVNAAALAADAVTEIQAGLATATALQTVDDNVDTLVSSITTVGAVADAVWDEARSGHTTQGTYGESFNTILSGNAASGTLSTTQMTTDLTEATDDHFNGRVLVWTSGVLLRQATAITDYDGTSKTLTFTAVTEAPTAGDDFIII